jgi:thioredoxin-dependent peroxiredoxin
VKLVDAALSEVGEPAPDFELRSNTGETWRLSENLGNVVALLFYPGNETLVCTKQMCSIRDHWSDYLETRAQIVGISPGSVDDHHNFVRNHRLPLPLLADEDRSVTNTFAHHWLWPTMLTRGIVVVDSRGIVRSRRIMLRAFRPTDRSVITDIYGARADAMTDRLDEIRRKHSSG